MIISHVYKPFVTVRRRGEVLLRFGVDAADAAKNHAFLFTERDLVLDMSLEESWRRFVLMKARDFLDSQFKEPW